MEQVNVEIVGQSSSSQTTEFSSVVDGSMWSSDGGEPVPETVTVTLTQKPGDGRYLTQEPGDGRFLTQEPGDGRYLTQEPGDGWYLSCILT